jgi:hypothetical protein
MFTEAEIPALPFMFGANIPTNSSLCPPDLAIFLQCLRLNEIQKRTHQLNNSRARNRVFIGLMQTKVQTLFEKWSPR